MSADAHGGTRRDRGHVHVFVPGFTHVFTHVFVRGLMLVPARSLGVMVFDHRRSSLSELRRGVKRTDYGTAELPMTGGARSG